MTQQVITAENGLTIIEEKPAPVQQVEVQLGASPQLMALHPQQVDLGGAVGQQIAIADSRVCLPVIWNCVQSIYEMELHVIYI